MEPTTQEMIDKVKRRDEVIMQSPDVQAEIERKKAEEVAKHVLKIGTARDMGTTAPPLPVTQPRKKKEDTSEYDKMSQIAQQVLKKGTSR